MDLHIQEYEVGLQGLYGGNAGCHRLETARNVQEVRKLCVQ